MGESRRRRLQGEKMFRLVMAWAVAAALSLAMTAHASADPCGGFSPGCGCGPAVAVVEPCGPLVESYLVHQGPTFSGPGHYLRQAGGSAPCCYPYVGFIYSGYPYGAFGPGGYPAAIIVPTLAIPTQSRTRMGYDMPPAAAPVTCLASSTTAGCMVTAGAKLFRAADCSGHRYAWVSRLVAIYRASAAAFDTFKLLMRPGRSRRAT